MAVYITEDPEQHQGGDPSQPDFRVSVVGNQPSTGPQSSGGIYGDGTSDRQGGGGNGGMLPWWHFLKKAAPYALPLLPGILNTANRPYSSNSATSDPPGSGSNTSSWRDRLGDRLGDLGDVLSGQAKGAADERGNVNDYRNSYNRALNDRYRTNQDATLEALLQSGRDKMAGYVARQNATGDAMAGKQGATSHALDAQSAEGLARARLAMDAPNAAAKQSILGSLMKNMQPHSFTSPAGQQGHLTKLSGGMSAANLDPMTRQHGEALMKMAMEKQLSGNYVPGPTDFKGGIQDWDKMVLDAPEATDYSKGVLLPPELQQYQNPGKTETGLSWAGTVLGLLGSLRK